MWRSPSAPDRLWRTASQAFSPTALTSLKGTFAGETFTGLNISASLSNRASGTVASPRTQVSPCISRLFTPVMISNRVLLPLWGSPRIPISILHTSSCPRRSDLDSAHWRFFGHPAPAAKRPPGKLSERRRRELFPGSAARRRRVGKCPARQGICSSQAYPPKAFSIRTIASSSRASGTVSEIRMNPSPYWP